MWLSATRRLKWPDEEGSFSELEEEEMSAVLGSPTRTIFGTRANRLHKFVSQISLAIADVLAFTTADLLFRVHSQVPVLVFFPGNLLRNHDLPVDVFYIISIIFIFVRFISGDYNRRELFWDSARTTSRALIVASVPDFLLMLLGIGIYSVSAIVLTWVFLMFSVPIFRQLARLVLQKAGLWTIPAALIGEPQRLTRIRAALSSSLSLGFDLRTVLSPLHGAEPWKETEGAANVSMSSPADLIAEASSAGCELVVIAAQDLQSEQTSLLAQAVLESGLSLAVVPSLQRLPLSGLAVNQFFGKDLLLLQVRDRSQDILRRTVKRMVDLVGSILLLTLCWPLFAAIAVAIKWYDKGPIFYGHMRIGRSGKPFRCLKFRTMASDADERLARWREEHPDLYAEFLKTYKLRNDPRVTTPGTWLRRTSLDELPQLFNVLRGEMSLVGPRPVLQRELDAYYGNAARLYIRVRPGMTGLWQVSGRSDTTYEERVTYDELYVLNWSFWYDLVILFQTAWFVIRGQGAF